MTSNEEGTSVDPANGLHGDDKKAGYIRIQAKRQIITEAGKIEAGETGFVPREWIQRVLSNKGCSCNGSVNWFEFV